MNIPPEEMKYLIEPPAGLFVCIESETPAEILASFKKTNQFYLSFVREHFIHFFATRKEYEQAVKEHGHPLPMPSVDSPL